MIIKETIREKILALGADVCGFGKTERFAGAPEGFRPTDLYADCKSVISVGIALPKGLLSMKHTVVACGVGQIGKSSLLLNPTYGNRLTLGAVLTNMDLESDPYCENICIPGCTKCLNACPVSAISDEVVTQRECRQNTYGSTARGFDTVDCNKCRSVCPMRDGFMKETI